MVVENQPKFGCGRVVGVQLTEKSDELPTPMAVDDRTVDMSGHQIHAGHQGNRSMAFVLVISSMGRIVSGNGRKVGRSLADRLNTRFLIIGNVGDQ